MKPFNIDSIKNTLYWKLRQVKKLIYYRRKATVEFWRNQQSIIQLIRQGKKVYIQPVPPLGGDGTTDNYFHFMFDLLLPLYLITREAPESRIGIAFVKLGYLKHYLHRLFPNQIFDSSQGHSQNTEIQMQGMNPLLVQISADQLRSFKSFMVDRLGLQLTARPDRVVLIERAVPANYMKPAGQFELRTGSLKRHIKNHELVKAYLENNLDENYQLTNSQLEFYTLEEQIELFDRAAVVIGQHGAGLANVCWMRPGSQVLEIRNDWLRTHYKSLCKYASLNYHHIHRRGAHIEMDLEKLDHLIAQVEPLKKIFNA